MALRTSHLPLRATTGTFILNAGLTHLKADEEAAKAQHAMAASAYPIFEDMDPQQFAKLLAGGEIALGAALLLPVIPSGLAGLGLAAFSGGLLGMYVKSPAMHEQGSLRPTRDGIALAKDSWMAGIAASLVIDEVAIRLARRAHRARLKAEVARRQVATRQAKAAGTVSGARKVSGLGVAAARKTAPALRRLALR